MRAEDLVTTGGAMATPDTRIADAAHLLAGREISAVPVLGAQGEVQRVVTAALPVRGLAGEAAGRPRGRYRALLARRAGGTVRGFTRLHGPRVGGVTTEPVSVQEDTPSQAIEQLVEERGVKRLPLRRELPALLRSVP